MNKNKRRNMSNKKSNRRQNSSTRKLNNSITLVGLIENPRYISTRTGTPMLTFEIDGKPFKAFNGKVNALAQFYNGQVRVEVTGKLSDHINPKGGPVEYELRELQPYLNTKAA